MKKKPVIMILGSQELPVPDVLGGGIEALLTGLLDENEKKRQARFVITSVYNADAAAHDYRFSTVYYFDSSQRLIKKGRQSPSFWRKADRKLCRIKNKLFHNRYTKRLFGDRIQNKDYLIRQYIAIAKKEKADYVVITDSERHEKYSRFNDLIGEDHVFFYLHFHKEEDLENRNAIRNSICLSRYVLDRWVQDKSIPGRNVVLYNGINLDRFKIPFDLTEREIRRQKLGIGKEDFAVVFCGRLIEVKGVEPLLDAFELLRGRPIKLILIGSVFYAKNKVTEFSRRMVARAKEMPNVIYLGYVPCTEMYNYYGIADAEVIPSIWQEGAGLIAVEGMTSGLPLIITQSGGMVEYVDDNCAIKLPINDDLPQNIAGEIVRLAEDRALCRRMGEAGKERAKKFSTEEYYRNFLSIFNQ